MFLHLFLAFSLFAFSLAEQQKIVPSNLIPNSSIFIDNQRNSNSMGSKRTTINNSANSNSPLDSQSSNKLTMPWENFKEQKPISSSTTSTLSSSASFPFNISSSSSSPSKLPKKQIVVDDSIRALRRRESKSAQEDEDYEDRIETSTSTVFQPAIRTYMPRRDAQSAEFLFPLQQEEEGENGAKEREQIGQSPKEMSNAFQVSTVPLMRLTKDVLAPGRYDVRVRPVSDHSKALKIHISMSLYQIIEVNEPAQNIKMNVWMIQKWRDQMLHWDPREYDMINSTILPHEVLWIPDTYLYNSVVMNAEETERYMNIRADSLYWEGQHGSNMSFLYPAIYTVTCRLNIRYFPYDQQNCTLTISSWTNSKSALDYYADPEVNLASFIANEEWDVMSFRIFRHEYKYACCPEPWVILEASIVIRRKPLYYVINLIIPTSIITLVAITGFFTPASTADDRTEKINLGITTLLAMSILMLMVSDQMPTTSEFVPLIAWFYLSIIIIISIGTFLTSVILSIQGRRQYGQLPSLWIRHLFFVKMAKWLWLSIPPPLLALWEEMNDHPLTAMEKMKKAEEEKKEGKRFQKSLRRSLKNSQKSNKAPSLAFEGDGSVVIQASPKDMSYRAQPIGGGGILSPVSEDGNMDWGGGEQQPQSPISNGSSRAKRNWLRVSSIMSKRSNQSNRTGGTLPSPRSPLNETGPPPIQLNMMNSSRRSSEAAINWDNAIGGLGVVTPRPKDPLVSARGKLVNKTVSVSAEVNSMKVKRQCSLEWEFLSTILDRLFLIIFSMTTLIVTFGMMFTGRVAQWQYEMAAKDLG